jgi:hypothetical protein
MRCDECGSNSVESVLVEGQRVQECALCGALYGDADKIERIDQIRESRDRGIDAGIYPLVKAIDGIPGARVFQSVEADPAGRVLPLILFHVDLGTNALELFMSSFTSARRLLKARWVVEVDQTRDLHFELKPHLPPGELVVDLPPLRIREIAEDTATLAQALRRDQSLSWWHPKLRGADKTEKPEKAGRHRAG